VLQCVAVCCSVLQCVAVCVAVDSGMGWLRLVGSLMLQVCFAEYSLFCRALLQKKPLILRCLLLVATPYQYEDNRICGAVCCSVLQCVAVCCSVCCSGC